MDGTLSRFIYSFNPAYVPFPALLRPPLICSGLHGDDQLWNSLANYAIRDTINLRAIPAKDKEILQHRIKALMPRLILADRRII